MQRIKGLTAATAATAGFCLLLAIVQVLEPLRLICCCLLPRLFLAAWGSAWQVHAVYRARGGAVRRRGDLALRVLCGLVAGGGRRIWRLFILGILHCGVGAPLGGGRHGCAAVLYMARNKGGLTKRCSARDEHVCILSHFGTGG